MPLLDYANPLFKFTNSNRTYTATKECWLFGAFYTSTATQLYINNTKIGEYTFYNINTSSTIQLPFIKLKAGDVVEFVGLTSAAADIGLAIYEEVTV